MTINELIEQLSKVDEEKKDLPIYVYDSNEGVNVPIDSVSLFDNLADHSSENMISININSENL